jgi:hypothetical protein
MQDTPIRVLHRRASKVCVRECVRVHLRCVFGACVAALPKHVKRYTMETQERFRSGSCNLLLRMQDSEETGG